MPEKFGKFSNNHYIKLIFLEKKYSNPTVFCPSPREVIQHTLGQMISQMQNPECLITIQVWYSFYPPHSDERLVEPYQDWKYLWTCSMTAVRHADHYAIGLFEVSVNEYFRNIIFE